MTIIVMVIFTAELIISSIVELEYLSSFFFWLDLISIVSMLLDISWFNDFIIDLINETGNLKQNQALYSTSLVRAGRGARIGARALKVLRILKLVR